MKLNKVELQMVLDVALVFYAKKRKEANRRRRERLARSLENLERSASEAQDRG